MRVFLILFLACFLTRISALHRSILDWDESLYFLMARAWAHGNLPYSTIWDNKPIGIYAIFAVFQAVFPGILAIRMATVCFVSALAFAVFRITLKLTQNRAAAWLAAGALILCSLSNDGLSANTELFMASFTAYAVLAALTLESALLVGLLLGCAFMVKYVAVFEAPVVALFLLSRTRRVATLPLTILGAALPLATTVLLYSAAGKFPLWLECSVLSNFRRVSAPLTAAALDYAIHIELLRWGTLYAAGLGMMVLAMARRRKTEIFLSAWLLAGLLGVAASKSFYDHYFLQVLPALCVILGVWLPRIRTARPAFILAALALPLLAAKTALRDTTGPDVPREIAAALPPHASLYVFDSQPIIYALANAAPPTRYVLPTEITGLLLPHVAGVNAAAELARILATHPQFIIRCADVPAHANPAIYAQMNAAVTRNYAFWKRFPGTVIYKEK